MRQASTCRRARRTAAGAVSCSSHPRSTSQGDRPPEPYRWTALPDLARLTADDDSGAALRELMAKPAPGKAKSPDAEPVVATPAAFMAGELEPARRATTLEGIAPGAQDVELSSFVFRLARDGYTDEDIAAAWWTRVERCEQTGASGKGGSRTAPGQCTRQACYRRAGTRTAGTELRVDVGALLAGGLPDRPKPVVLRRTDGDALFYRGAGHSLFGDPESGKTWVVSRPSLRRSSTAPRSATRRSTARTSPRAGCCSSLRPQRCR